MFRRYPFAGESAAKGSKTMIGQMHDRLTRSGAASPRSGVWAPVAWLGGLLAATAAVTIGALLAVFTAAAVAVIAVIASILFFVTGLAVRARRTVRARTGGDNGLIEAHKVDGTWVAYGWERQNR